MEKEIIRKKLVEIQDQIISDIKQRLAENSELVNMDANETHDPEDYSHQAESTEMKNILRGQLEKAEFDRNKLESLDFTSKSKIESGAVVKTEQFTFVIGVATTPFDTQDGHFVGISTEAPIFSVMRDKAVGDQFEYGNNHYTIQEIL